MTNQLDRQTKGKSRKIIIGKTTYILSSNFVPNRENKEALIKAIQHIMKNRVKPVK